MLRRQRMLIVQICVGSSCHLKGSEEIVKRFQQAVRDNNLEDEVILTGCFCKNMCEKPGVTIEVNDDLYTSVTPEGFDLFFKEHILDVVREG